MDHRRLAELLVWHQVGFMTISERDELNRMLKEKYDRNVAMPEYCCPRCKRPLIFSWAWKPVCPIATGGCGWKLPSSCRR